MNKLGYFLLGLVIVSGCTPPHESSRETGETPLIVNGAVQSRLDSALKSLVDEGRVVGASALVFEKGEEVYFNAFGYADREAQTPMDRSTIVRIYSMTKPVTGVALMTLFEEGRFQQLFQFDLFAA